MRRSFGPAAKNRVKRILEALMVFAVEDPKGELHSYFDKTLLISPNPQLNQMVVKASAKQIADLVNHYERRLRQDFPDEISTWQVADTFEHFKKTLNIFEDLRIRKQGSELWAFRLTLWHSMDQQRKNLDEIDLRLKRFHSEESIEEISKSPLKSQHSKRWWERDLKPINFTPFLVEKRKYFTGREWLFDEIDFRCVLGNEQAIIITGDPGSGKSAFLSEFIYRHPQQVIGYHCCHADIEQTINPEYFIRSIAGMIARRLDSYATVLSDPSFKEILSERACKTDPLGAFEFGVLNPLHSLAQPPKDILFILIDGIDAVTSSREFGLGQSIVQLLAARLQRLPQWLRIIATSRKETQTLLRLSRQGVLNIESEDVRNKMDIARYLDQRLKDPRIIELLRISGRTNIDLKICLREAANGNFLYIQQALEGIENNTYSFSNLSRMPPGLSSLYLSFLEHSFPNPNSYELARQLLQVIAVSKDILSAAQLATVTGMNLDIELYPLLYKLNTYLSHEKSRNKNDGYTFYHKSLTDWLTGDDARQTFYYISVEQGHKQMALCCEQLLQNPTNGWEKYLDKHTPFHFIESGYIERFFLLLTHYPELIRYTIDVVVSGILIESDGSQSKSRKFLQYLVDSDEYISVIILIEIASMLVDFEHLHTAKHFINQIYSTHPYLQLILKVMKYQSSLIEMKSSESIQQVGYTLKEYGIPIILKGIFQYYLSEHFELSGKYRMAQRTGEQAIKNLSPGISFNYWMKAQCAMSRFEVAFGRLPDAWNRLRVLQKGAEVGDSTTHLATIYEIRGQIHYELGQYIEAKNCFQISIEILEKNKQSQKVLKVLNSLGLVETKLNTENAVDIIEKIRQLSKRSQNFLEIWRNYLLEVELYLENKEIDIAMDLLKKARKYIDQNEFNISMLKYNSLETKILIELGRFDTSIHIAKNIYSFLKSEQIYPGLRLEVYHLIMTASNNIGKEASTFILDDPPNIQYLEYFSSMQDLIKKYFDDKIKIVKPSSWQCN